MVGKSRKRRQCARKKVRHPLEFTMKWGVFARTTLERALGDIRAYEMNPTRAKLLPPKKERVVVTTTSLSPVKEVEKTSPDDI